jgi:hypothetical protein
MYFEGDGTVLKYTKKKRQELIIQIQDAIQSCESTLNDNSKSLLDEIELNQVKKIIIPEFMEVLQEVKVGTRINTKNLQTRYFVLDSWNYNSPLGLQLITLINHF